MFLLLVLFAGCDQDDGGGGAGAGTVQLFFGTNNIRPCRPITADVAVVAANAVVAVKDDGSPDCALDAALAGSGCAGTFDLVDGGATLHVTIDGCDVPEVTNLFECEFTQGDASTLSAVTSAICDCVGEQLCSWNIFCDYTPGICVSDSADPGACEDCYNGVDDDADGRVDCEDQDCHNFDCGWGQTTVTCSSTTTTTTTTTLGAVTSTTVAFTATRAPSGTFESRSKR